MSTQPDNESLSIIYKYCDFSSEYTMNNIKNSVIYFNDPENFDDPFDCHIDYDLSGISTDWIGYFLKNGLDEASANPFIEMIKNGRINIDDTKHKLRKHLSMLRISSFSKCNKNILLWSHYAKNHSGICLGFEVHHKISNGNWMHLCNEDVSKLRPVPSVPSGALPLIKITYDDRKPTPYNPLRDSQERVNEFAFQKYKSWEYQSEYRIVLHKNQIHNNTAHYNPVELKEIIFGINTNPAYIKKVIDVINKLPEKGKWIDIYQAFRGYNKYSVDIKLMTIKVH
jgi:hypothetical protein